MSSEIPNKKGRAQVLVAPRLGLGAAVLAFLRAPGDAARPAPPSPPAPPPPAPRFFLGLAGLAGWNLRSAAGTSDGLVLVSATEAAAAAARRFRPSLIAWGACWRRALPLATRR